MINRRSLIAGLAALPVAGAAALLAREGDAGVKPRVFAAGASVDFDRPYLTGERGGEMIVSNEYYKEAVFFLDVPADGGSPRIILSADKFEVA